MKKALVQDPLRLISSHLSLTLVYAFLKTEGRAERTLGPELLSSSDYDMWMGPRNTPSPSWRRGFSRDEQRSMGQADLEKGGGSKDAMA